MKITSDGYTIVRNNTGKLNASQVQGIENIVQASTDANWTYPQCAYALATAYHETAGTFQPVVEYGSTTYLQSKRYYPYIGRGLVQITWQYNYKKFGDLLSVDLVNNPDKALQEDISIKIMVFGMSKGLFTGKGYNNLPLRKYNLQDYVDARRIINGVDKALDIANKAMMFEKALRSL